MYTHHSVPHDEDGVLSGAELYKPKVCTKTGVVDLSELNPQHVLKNGATPSA